MNATPTLETIAVEVTDTALRAWRDEFGSVFAHVVVEARNPGPSAVELHGVDASYAIRSEDGAILHAGAFVHALPAVVPPRETAYFVDTVRLDFAESTDLGRLDVDIRPADVTASSDAGLTVSDVSWQRRPDGGLEVSGTVHNPSDAAISTAIAAVVLLDRDGELLGGVYDATDAAEIPAGGEAEFSAGYPRTPPIDPAAVGSVRALAFAARGP